MNDSDRYSQEADERARLAVKQQEEIDLRAGQIDKLQQEMTFYQQEKDKYLNEQQEWLRKAQEAAKQEGKDKEKRREQAILNAAQMMANNNR